MANIMAEVRTEVAKVPTSKLLPKPAGHDLPLKIQVEP